jgi:hypothetical protein
MKILTEVRMKKETREILFKVILHMLAWAVLLGLPLYLMIRFEVKKDFLLTFYGINLINGLIFYTNYLILVPRLFFQKRKYKYYLSAIALIACFYFVSNFSMKILNTEERGDRNTEQFNRPPDEKINPGPPRGGELAYRFPLRTSHIMGYTSSAIFLVFFSLGLKVLERQSKIEKIQEEMEKEKLNSELAFLKNQISPHFFFNTLNNIYSLVSISPEDSQNAILRLSKLMRYLLYESEQGNTMLSQEIDFMNNYIDLMKLRTSEKVSLNICLPEKFEDRRIAPLLFVPFIENAFKHGISNREKSFIDISMEINGDSIIFRCSNSVHTAREIEAIGNKGGIGLENVKKRLNLLFPERHDLKISKSEKQFDVNLRINLS